MSKFRTSPPGAWAYKWKSWTIQRCPVPTSSSNHRTLSFSPQRGDDPLQVLCLLQQEDPSSTSHSLLSLPADSGTEGRWSGGTAITTIRKKKQYLLCPYYVLATRLRVWDISPHLSSPQLYKWVLLSPFSKVAFL